METTNRCSMPMTRDPSKHARNGRAFSILTAGGGGLTRIYSNAETMTSPDMTTAAAILNMVPNVRPSAA